MRRKVLRTKEVMTREALVEVTAFRQGRKFYVASVIFGDEFVVEAAGEEAALISLELRVAATRNLVKEPPAEGVHR